MATAGQSHSPGLFSRRTSRRGVIGGSLAAASLAVTYAALGDPLSLLGGESSRGDSEAIGRESVKISHLLRRTGFGVTHGEFEHYQSLGLQGTLDELLNWTNVDDSEAERLADETPMGPGGRRNPAVWWLTLMANTKRPLREKMTLFWHGLLTSQLSVVRDPDAMLAQNQFFRDHAFDTFPVILKGISADPAMMVYLNVDGSNRSAPNENYARELMELFSLGVGNYSETDVREAARAFTGWQVRKERGSIPGVLDLLETAFLPQRFDGGSKTFLGKTGNFRPDDIVEIIAEQPAAGAYITRRLFSFFVYPNPDDRDIKPFVQEYTKSGGNIGAVVSAMLRSDAFYSPRAYRSIVKSPIEYSVGALKALGLQAGAAYLAAGGGPRGGGVLSTMGQVPFEPPNVAGWPGHAAWLNSATMFARLNFINLATSGGLARLGQQAQGRQDQRQQQAQQAALAGLPAGTTSQALEHFLPMALDDNLPEEARQVLLEYGGGPDTNLSTSQLRGLAYLVLGSPQFHLS